MYKDELKNIPSKEDLLQIGLVKKTRLVLEHVKEEFSEEGAYAPFAKAQDTPSCWKWYVELPFAVSEIEQHAVRDALAEKLFDHIHFNDHHAFETNFTRMSITINKGDK
jgi:hypothetical protein